ncbi:glutathione S-transferase family protein [Marinobacter zhejiangensis]|uniref:Putative glutathione S-transferase n=1 Tax=Marinobacter zhejiangensis TaxID=488535 RepID=A0A1I4S8F4_9GAMM|nr:glutathione S-transferase family protein [Marinobacter zhejiangensis]SFM60786.1 putative glutathione S-transferase [Marinobacter zhejiangensis]
MGVLVDGCWHDRWYDTAKTGGSFEREASRYRRWITPDGDSSGGFKAESGRYHLYVSMACPWAHRTLIIRSLKGLDKHITVSVVHPDMLEQGWQFVPTDSRYRDDLYSLSYLHQLYTRVDRTYSGRVTVPVLWDKKLETIVNNESADIIRMLNQAFDGLDGVRGDRDFYPAELQQEIDEVNSGVYEAVNNGVYRTGFATSQAAYEQAFGALFECMDWLDERLAGQRYLVGNRLTEADWRLFTTLVRFDAVYYSHFKCNRRQIRDYPNLSGYLRDLYQVPGVAETVDLDQIKQHYYVSQRSINPTQIVPVGPELDFMASHGRGALGADFV